MSESLILAKYIVECQFEDLSPKVVEVTKRSLLDGIGVTLGAGGLCEPCQAFVDMAVGMEGKKEATIIGFGERVPAEMAAFANGSMAHALDFEDAHDRALVHSNAVVIPAALAIAEALGNVDGKKLVTALAIGSDLVCRLGLCFREDPADHGWYTPPIVGAFGAAAAVGKLLNLNEQQMLDAFSLTLCQATCSAELKYSPLSDIRAVRDAFAAKAGLISARLAQKGVKGFDLPFEGKAGFFQLYVNGKFDSQELTGELRQRFEGSNVSFKPWPTCRGTHAYIEAALKLSDEYDIKVENIKEINVVVSNLNKMLVEPIANKQNPATSIDAKFSLPFTIAAALIHRKINLGHFTAEGLKDQEVIKLGKKLKYTVDPDIPFQESGRGYIELVDHYGQTYSLGIKEAYGNPNNPITQQGIIEKFKDCASRAKRQIPEDDLEAVIDQILSIERIGNVSEVLKRL